MSTLNTTRNRTLWVGVTAAIASSLCCVAPVLAALAGVGSLAGSFHWVGPARPYLIGVALLALGYAWWLKLKPVPVDDCNCDVPQRRSFLHSTGFMVAVTAFALITSAYPLFADGFGGSSAIISNEQQGTMRLIMIDVKGMTCTGCEAHVNAELAKVDGVVEHSASFEEGTATVRFDPAKTRAEELVTAIERAGYEGTLTNTKDP